MATFVNMFRSACFFVDANGMLVVAPRALGSDVAADIVAVITAPFPKDSCEE